GMALMGAANAACASRSTGRCQAVVAAGYLPRGLSSRQLGKGRTGRGAKPPAQVGQTSSSTSRTQAARNGHSNEQIIASLEAGGKALLQCSQLGRRLSIVFSPALESDAPVGRVARTRIGRFRPKNVARAGSAYRFTRTRGVSTPRGPCARAGCTPT